MDEHHLADELDGARRRSPELIAELLEKRSIGQIRVRDEPPMEIVSDAQRPDRLSWGEKAVVLAKRDVFPARSGFIDGTSVEAVDAGHDGLLTSEKWGHFFHWPWTSVPGPMRCAQNGRIRQIAQLGFVRSHHVRPTTHIG
jgi:hypothetical protein